MMNEMCLLNISPDTLSDWRSHLLDNEQDLYISEHVATCSTCQVTIRHHERIARSLRDIHTSLTGSEVWTAINTQIGTKRIPSAYHQQGLIQRYGATATIVLLFLAFFSLIVRHDAQRTISQIPTPTSLTDPFSGPPTYSNPMTSNRQDGWTTDAAPAAPSPNISCMFEGDGYHMVSPASYRIGCDNTHLSWADFALQIQMMFIQGGAGNWGGIAFREDVNPGASYNFEVQADGHYDLTWCSTSFCDFFLTQGVATNFHKGLNQPNILGVVARGSSLSIYLNHVLLQQVTDTHIHKGFVGLRSGSVDAQTTCEVVYRDLEEWDK